MSILFKDDNKNMDMKQFGTNLAKHRINKNLSAYELSLRIDKSSSYIHKVECAKINISLKTILEICKVLEIEPSELFE